MTPFEFLSFFCIGWVVGDILIFIIKIISVLVKND